MINANIICKQQTANGTHNTNLYDPVCIIPNNNNSMVQGLSYRYPNRHISQIPNPAIYFAIQNRLITIILKRKNAFNNKFSEILVFAFMCLCAFLQIIQ